MQRYQPGVYEKWKLGEDRAPHPEDDQSKLYRYRRQSKAKSAAAVAAAASAAAAAATTTTETTEATETPSTSADGTTLLVAEKDEQTSQRYGFSRKLSNKEHSIKAFFRGFSLLRTWDVTKCYL